MITTVIFDIGNVLADFTWREHFAGFGYDEEMIERIARATVYTPAWNEYDKGVLSFEQIMQRFVEADPAIEADIRRVMDHVKTMVRRNDYAIPWIRDLKNNGYRVLYLSNFSQKAETECAYALDFIPYTDGGILSYREQVIKPMPQIYERLIRRYGLVPEECVFLDDTEANLTGAQKLGIHTILFRDQAQAVEELRALGVRTKIQEEKKKTP